MRIAQVIGNLTLNRCHPSFEGARLRLAIPVNHEELMNGTDPQGEPLIVWDELGAGNGDMIAVSEGPEASQPFRPDIKPVDAYAAAILDSIDVGRS